MNKSDKFWSLSSEAAVLGSMIIDPKCIGNVMGIVESRHFHLPEHQTIFSSICALYLGNVHGDAVALRADLISINQLDKIGGVKYLAKIMESVPSSANALYYAGVVLGRFRFRGLITATEQMKSITDEAGAVDDLIQRVQDVAMGFDRDQASKYYELADEVDRVFSHVDDKSRLICTGISGIDNIIDGVRKGQLIVIGGASSMGKTALTLQIARNMAMNGLKVLFVSLEMSSDELIERSLLSESVEDLKKCDIIIHETANTAEKIISFARTVRGLGVIFVDYLQLMSGEGENRLREINNITLKLKLAAGSEEVPIFLVSQLNRGVTSRENHRPRMSDLKESGDIENNADKVFLVYREDYYRQQEDPNATMDGQAEVIIAKNRGGRTGVADLLFLNEKVIFAERWKN